MTLLKTYNESDLTLFSSHVNKTARVSTEKVDLITSIIQ